MFPISPFHSEHVGKDSEVRPGVDDVLGAFGDGLPSLKLTYIVPENRPFNAPKGKETSIPIIHFQGRKC